VPELNLARSPVPNPRSVLVGSVSATALTLT